MYRDMTDISINNWTTIIYDLRFRFVPPRCVIRWRGGLREGRGIVRFRFRSTSREDPGDNLESASPRGDRCVWHPPPLPLPPLMNPTGPRACGRDRGWLREREREERVFSPAGAGGHLGSSRDLSLTAARGDGSGFRIGRARWTPDGRTLRDASDYRIKRTAVAFRCAHVRRKDPRPMILMVKKEDLAGWIRAYTIRGCATRRRRSWRHQGSIEVGAWGSAPRAPVRLSVISSWSPEPSAHDKTENRTLRPLHLPHLPFYFKIFSSYLS